MTDWYSTVCGYIKADLESALSAYVTTTDQLFTVAQDMIRNIVSDAVLALQGDSSVTPPPYVICGFGKAQKAGEDAGLDGNIWLVPLDVWIVVQASSDSGKDQQFFAHSLANLVAQTLTANTSSYYGWLGDPPMVDSSVDVAMEFYEDAVNLWAAKVSFDQGLLVMVS